MRVAAFNTPLAISLVAPYHMTVRSGPNETVLQAFAWEISL